MAEIEIASHRTSHKHTPASGNDGPGCDLKTANLTLSKKCEQLLDLSEKVEPNVEVLQNRPEAWNAIDDVERKYVLKTKAESDVAWNDVVFSIFVCNSVLHLFTS